MTDETHRLSEPLAALRAGRAADRDHARLLLLAGIRLAAAVALSRLAFWRSADLHPTGKLPAPGHRRGVLPERGHQLRVLVLRNRAGPRAGPAARLAGQREDPRAYCLSLVAPVAL